MARRRFQMEINMVDKTTEVTDKMVKAAYRAWARSVSATDFDRLRAAIEAALAAREPVDAKVIGD